jgi:uncharacterized membrane protein
MFCRNIVSSRKKPTAIKQLCTVPLLVVAMLFFNACKKTHTPIDPCAGVIIAVTAATTDANARQNNGAITATATGGSDFTFSLNNSAFQSSGTFSKLPAGAYTVIAKSSNGCIGSAQVTLNIADSCAGQAGLLFTAVKTLLQANCVPCHNAATSRGDMNWTVDCNIIKFKDRIKVRAVDSAGTVRQMPLPPRAPLSLADRQKITDWIAAGGAITN